jgi:phage N-6-adenine-methyltransferase
MSPLVQQYPKARRAAAGDSGNDRSTPRWIFDPLNGEWGFTLDAAASPRNAKCAEYFTKETDGLLRSWAGHRVWCNPPYRGLEAWVAKAWAEMRAECRGVVMLIPANRCEQPFWQQYVEPFRDLPMPGDLRLNTRFLAGRHTFDKPDSLIRRSDKAPFGLVLLIWTHFRDLIP